MISGGGSEHSDILLHSLPLSEPISDMVSGKASIPETSLSETAMTGSKSR